MSRAKKKDYVEGEDDHLKHRDMKKYRIIGDHQIINGHMLKDGDVVELELSDAVSHQEHGMRFDRCRKKDEDGRLVDDDDAEVTVDVSKPYVAEEKTDDKQAEHEGEVA